VAERFVCWGMKPIRRVLIRLCEALARSARLGRATAPRPPVATRAFAQ
jgi:hypothetical protein